MWYTSCLIHRRISSWSWVRDLHAACIHSRKRADVFYSFRCIWSDLPDFWPQHETRRLDIRSLYIGVLLFPIPIMIRIRSMSLNIPQISRCTVRAMLTSYPSHTLNGAPSSTGKQPCAILVWFITELISYVQREAFLSFFWTIIDQSRLQPLDHLCSTWSFAWKSVTWMMPSLENYLESDSRTRRQGELGIQVRTCQKWWVVRYLIILYINSRCNINVVR